MLGADKVCGTSLRMGSSNDIADHPQAGIYHAIMAGGWECEDLNRVFCYMMALKGPMGVAGRVLAGWPNPRVKAPTPNLHWVKMNLDSTKQGLLDDFIYDLFQLSYLEQQFFAIGTGKLWLFVETMAASLLMYLAKRCADVTAGHPVIVKILNTAPRFGFTKKDLFAFGKSISIKWKQKIREAQQLVVDGQDLREVVTQELSNLGKEVQACDLRVVHLWDTTNKIGAQQQQQWAEVRQDILEMKLAIANLTKLVSNAKSAECSGSAEVLDNSAMVAPENLDTINTNSFPIVNSSDNSNVTQVRDAFVTLSNNSHVSQYHVETLTKLTVSKFLFEMKTRNQVPSCGSEVKSALTKVYRLAYYCADAMELQFLNDICPNPQSGLWSNYINTATKICDSLQRKIAQLVEEKTNPENQNKRTNRKVNTGLISTLVKNAKFNM